MQSSPPTTLVASPLRWHAPMLVKASVASHAGAGLTLLAQPSLWPWAVGVLVLNHAVLAIAGLRPRSTWLGHNMSRLPAASVARGEVAITIDDGPDPAVTPAVLDLLDAHHARATFFCIARQAELHPQLCREIIRRGHSVQNHTHRHSHAFSFSGPRAFEREIQLAQDSLSHITGLRPVFFRAPAGFRNLFLAPVLHKTQLQLASWTRRGFDTASSDSATVLSRLARGLRAGDILLLHDANCAIAASGKPVVLEVLPALLQRIEQAGLRCVTLPQAMLAAPAKASA